MTNNKIIEATAAFKKLDKVTQVIYKRKQMMDIVKRELEVARTIGFESYVEKYNPDQYKKDVIQELLSTI
ncbi:hypothetical protein GOQ30_11455 [Flavobacterium sp. TP390]|uniref:Uncharacterized protein n=1 Tax=Flavobacterium profundi TaxID=1774945 RepID=A0A6I4IJ89_9FLAO|nr:hypothetical protein [Flavobacterium profundi]MVO09775.1 hypothetical protein [Flavobacterium profundi]